MIYVVYALKIRLLFVPKASHNFGPWYIEILLDSIHHWHLHIDIMFLLDIKHFSYLMTWLYSIAFLISAVFSLRNNSSLFLSHLYSVSSWLKVYDYDSASSHNNSVWSNPWPRDQPHNMTVLFLTCCTKILTKHAHFFNHGFVTVLCYPCLLKLVKFCK